MRFCKNSYKNTNKCRISIFLRRWLVEVSYTWTWLHRRHRIFLRIWVKLNKIPNYDSNTRPESCYITMNLLWRYTISGWLALDIFLNFFHRGFRLCRSDNLCIFRDCFLMRRANLRRRRCVLIFWWWFWRLFLFFFRWEWWVIVWVVNFVCFIQQANAISWYLMSR